MKKHLIIFLLALCYTTLSFAQSNFYKTFDLGEFEDFIKTYDKGFACLTVNGILKLDSNIQLQFYKEYSSDSIFILGDIVQTTDSGYIIVSYYNSFNPNELCLVVKFDKNGNYLWTKRYPTSTTTTAFIIWDAIDSDNNGFYMIGSRGSDGILYMKCNENGENLWSIKTTYTNTARKILKYAEDKFLIFGEEIVSGTLRKINVYLIDTSGTILWLKEYDNNNYNMVFDAIKTTNNEFSILSTCYENGLTFNTILHIDSSGNFLFSKKIFTTELIQSFQLYRFAETIDKGYLLTGEMSHSNASPYSKILYCKTDSLNNIEWTRYFGNISANNQGQDKGINVFNRNENNYVFSSSNVDGFSVTKLDSNGYGFCTYQTLQFTSELMNYTVTDIPVNSFKQKLLSENDSLGFNSVAVISNIYCTNVNAINNIELPNNFNYYPNPTHNLLTIENPSTSTKTFTLSLTNIQDQLLLSEQVEIDKNHTIDLSNFPNGIYFLRLQNAKENYVRKVVVQR